MATATHTIMAMGIMTLSIALGTADMDMVTVMDILTMAITITIITTIITPNHILAATDTVAPKIIVEVATKAIMADFRILQEAQLEIATEALEKHLVHIAVLRVKLELRATAANIVAEKAEAPEALKTPTVTTLDQHEAAKAILAEVTDRVANQTAVVEATVVAIAEVAIEATVVVAQEAAAAVTRVVVADDNTIKNT